MSDSLYLCCMNLALLFHFHTEAFTMKLFILKLMHDHPIKSHNVM